MDPVTYSNFWTEEPPVSKKTWRPTDAVRQKLQRFWLVQALLLAGVLLMAALLVKESQRKPTVYAKLPNGIVLETSPQPLSMDRLARMEMVNNVLQFLYYQDGRNSFINAIQLNVMSGIAKRLQMDIQQARSAETTVHISVAETFQIGVAPGGAGKGFAAMTKAYLTKKSDKESTTAPIYIRTQWVWQNNRYVLQQLTEKKTAEYVDAFNREKERIRNLSPEELKREIDVKQDKEIKIVARNPLAL